jgi:hypothetical protein
MENIQHSLEEVRRLLKGLEVLHPELFFLKTPAQKFFDGVDEKTFTTYVLELVNTYRASKGYPKINTLLEAKEELIGLEELLRKPESTLPSEEIIGIEAIEEFERQEREKTSRIEKSHRETKEEIGRIEEAAKKKQEEEKRKTVPIHKKVYLNTQEEGEVIFLTPEEQQLLETLVQKAKEDPKSLAEDIAAEVYQKAVEKTAGSVPKDVLKNQAEITADNLVSTLLLIDPEEISPQMRITNPNEILVAISKNESLKGIESPITSLALSEAARDIINISKHDTEVAINYLGSTSFAPVVKIFYNKEVKPRDFEITSEPTPSSKFEARLDNLQEYYTIRWRVADTIKELNPDLSLTDKEIDVLTTNLFHLTGRQYRAAGYYLTHLQTLGSPILSKAFEIGQEQTVAYTYLSPIVEKLNLNIPFELAVSLESGKPVLGFGLRVGPFGKNLFAIGTSTGKGALAAGGKAAAAAAAKTAATTAAKTGLSATLKTAFGALLGPQGLIASAVIQVGQNIVSKTLRWLKEHQEVVYAIIGLPFVIVGMIFGMPAVTIGGLGIGVVGASGGIKGAASALGKVFAAITYLTVSSIAVPLIACLIGIPLVVAFIIFIINSSAYVVPPGASSQAGVGGGGTLESPYVGIKKTVNPTKSANITSGKITLSYTIEITAKKEAITITNIENSYSVIGSSTSVPSTVPSNPFDAAVNSTISQGQKITINYSLEIGKEFNDSAIKDVVIVTVNTASNTSSSASADATAVIGSPPIDCPIPGAIYNYGSYDPKKESGHGSNAYWGSLSCTSWPLPQQTGCYGPSDPTATANKCFNQSNKCSYYGYAIDVKGNDVYAPTVGGQAQTWNCSYAFANGGGNAGYTFICSSGQYKLVLTHMAKGAKTGAVTSGEKIGTTYAMSNRHLHIEFAVNGQYVKPEDYFCSVSP